MSAGIASLARPGCVLQRRRGEGHDNALAETINGLYKAEAIRRRGPYWRRWNGVAWFDYRRLMEPLGYAPPAEFEATHHQQRAGQAAPI